MAETVPEVEQAAVEAWRRKASSGGDAHAVLQHGLRVAHLMRSLADPGSARALTVAAVLHEVGLFVKDRGHFALRGARWVAIHLDSVLPQPSTDERRLLGELILFHRHRGALPGGLLRPDLVDAFRCIESWDRSGGRDPDPAGWTPVDIQRAREEHPTAGFPAALHRLQRAEWLRHPLLWRRTRHIRRPDR